MDISVSRQIISQLKYQRVNGKKISILYNMGEIIMVIIHTSKSRAKILLFCDHQDTEYEERELENSVLWSIFTQ